METNLRVVNGAKGRKIVNAPVEVEEVSEAELTVEENKLRERARTIVKDIDDKYWELGEILYDVYDGVPGGYRALMKGKGSREERRSMFSKWGYKTFGEYCEEEVGIRKRTAENIRYAYYWFSITLDLPESVMEDLRSIGRSKFYQLAGFADETNITVWIDQAKTLTFEELRKAIKAAKAVAAGSSGDSEERDQAAGPAAEAAKDAKALPKPEEWHTLQTSLADSQWATWQSAFDRAKGISGSEKIGHNMELICQDFLANNDFADDAAKDRSAFLAKIERKLGLLLIGIDPASGKPVHGRDLLWRLVKECQAEALEEDAETA